MNTGSRDSAPGGDSERRSVRVTGVVQGVGFRPFVFGLATGLGLVGHVGNDSAGVFCEVEGAPSVLDEFEQRLVDDAPPLAHVDSVESAPMGVLNGTGFEIVASRPMPGALTLVSADIAPCEDCTRELFDHADRRYRYPYINCTNCGPRFSITRDVPYDRPNTTMAGFELCVRCQAEYDDPLDRRFHAQPVACPECGPHVWLEPPGESDPIADTRALIGDGRIVAIKGVGGFQLACRADSEAAVDELRRRKGRVDKPFAVMAADLDTVRTIAEIGPAEERLLSGVERPIVLLRKRHGSSLAAGVAPGNQFVGVMLPSSPLHLLLLEAGDVWVMTSGNRSQEPICTDNNEAQTRLAHLADAFLLSDRPIHVPVDDSVVRVLDEAPGAVLPIRRSRGYAPYPVPLTFDAPPVLAVGGELKATACLTAGRHAFMSQHIGDMENLETFQMFERVTDHLIGLFKTEPQVIACDMHPGYLSTRWAREHAGERSLIEVQHHHAHIASLLAEHGHPGPIIGFSFDGTGYGTDGTIWGGEILLADLREFTRIGHLASSVLAGADAAVRHPRRQALTRLREAGLDWGEDLPPVGATPLQERRVLSQQLERQLNTIETTSMGRLFDAVSSLTGVCHVAGYEGQAAIELESIIDTGATGAYEVSIEDGVWHTTALITQVVRDVRSGVEPGVVSLRFHRAIADAMVRTAAWIRSAHGIDVVGLSGGVFQNITLTRMAIEGLGSGGFEVLTHRLVPPNDGGLALGQAAVAAHRRT